MLGIMTGLLLTTLSVAQVIEAPAEWKSESIQVMGFCHKDKEGNCWMAAQPFVRSCCVGHTGQMPQLFVEGDVEIHIGRLQAIEGYLEYSMQKKMWVLHAKS